MTQLLREHAEQQYAEELHALAQHDQRTRPPNWRLSPWAVATYILGGTLEGGFVVSPKYIGSRRLIEIAIATLATDRGLLLLGVPGTAKCVKYDTLVLDTRTGRRMTIAQAYRERSIEIASLNADYRLRPQAPVEYIDNGVRSCYRVTTHLGRQIEVTLNHPFLTLDGWRPLSELSSGDRIAVPRSLPFFGEEQLSDAHVKLLAHLIAEGCLSQDVPYYTNTDPDMQDDLSDAVVTAFPALTARWYPSGKSCSISGGRRGPHFHNPCTQWLQSLGLMGLKSEHKFVPDIIFCLSRRQIALFLNRLFSGDGYLQVRSTSQQVTIDYASKSKRLIQDVQHLLLRYGINARVVRRSSGHYRLFIQGKEPCRIFLEEIGLLGRGGTKRVLTDVIVGNAVTNPNLDTIPPDIWQHLECAAHSAGYSSLGSLVRVDRSATYKTTARRSQSMSRTRLLRLATLVNDADLRQLAQSDIYWDTIVSIEPMGEHQVYDLSMAETHNFVANDIIVHNSWVSEHLAAAIAGDSTLLVQGTAGTSEEAIRYGWNYARLLAEGPSPRALVPSPVMRAMDEGKIARVEELTRIPADVQDTLITILSEKTLPIPELNSEVQAVRGFNVIATANNRDRGVNELSSALKRRFNTVVLPLPDTLDEEVTIVQQRVAEPGPRAGAAGRAAGAGGDPPDRDDLPRAARGRHRRRQDQAQVAQRHAQHRRGDLGGQQRPGAGGALRRRPAARRRRGRGPGRRRGQRPGAGPRRLAGVPGDGREGARRLEGPVPRLPRVI